MNTIQKLHKIEKEKCIYDIHYCMAGVGFIFYEPDPGYDKDKDTNTEGWRKFLRVDAYYKTFVKAVNAEYKKLCHH